MNGHGRSMVQKYEYRDFDGWQDDVVLCNAFLLQSLVHMAPLPMEVYTRNLCQKLSQTKYSTLIGHKPTSCQGRPTKTTDKKPGKVSKTPKFLIVKALSILAYLDYPHQAKKHPSPFLPAAPSQRPGNLLHLGDNHGCCGLEHQLQAEPFLIPVTIRTCRSA